MTPLEIIRQNFSADLVNAEGQPWGMTLLPGLTEEEIAGFEDRLGFALRDDIKELLRFTNGITGGPLAAINFNATDEYCAVEEDNGFAWKTLGFAADGVGNHWGYALSKDSTDLGPIYFFSHDPPVFLHQSPDLSRFLEEFFKLCQPPYKSLLDGVMQDGLKNVWVDNPGLVEVANARASSDPVLADFAKTLPDHWKLLDLRNPEPGAGFSWGRCRDFRRHDNHLIFGMDFKQPGWLTKVLRKFTDKA